MLDHERYGSGDAVAGKGSVWKTVGHVQFWRPLV